jgi:phage gp36-like protein
MGWLTNGDIEARVEESTLLSLADDDGDLAADTDVMDAVRADAEGEVEAHLAGRYQVPFTTADKVLKEIGSAIAINKLYLRKSVDSPQHVKDAIAQAVTALRRLAKGEMNLSVGTLRGDAAKSTADPDDREFTRKSLEDY